MSNLDEKIRAALSEEYRRAFANIKDQPGLWEMLAMALKGKQAWMTWYMWIMGLVIFVLGLYCLSQFLATDDVKQSLTWMLGIQVCLSFIVITKVLGWQQLQKLELLREIKRLELRQLLAAGEAGD